MADPSAKGLHFVIVPFLAQGHLIPMVDISRILAQRGASVTIFATPVNANRFKPLIFRAKQAGLKIQLLELEIPLAKVGLPEGCENFDLLPSPTLTMNLLNAVIMLQNPFEEAMRELEPKPSCIISDNCLHWTLDVAKRLDIPRLVFHGPGCFFLLCWHNLIVSRITDGICNGSEKFVIPGLPDRVEITKGKAGRMVDTGSSAMNSYYEKMRDAERSSYGIIINSFEELEPQYVKEYQEAKRDVKVWCIGPVSLCNQSRLDKAERGNKASIDEHCCLQWLDSWDPRSVIYVCFGTVSRTSTANMIELALALELSNRPFIWCIKRAPDGFGAWFSSYGFQERVKDKGLIIQGWAPQVLILSHQAIGGVLTHCGWNSVLEAICVGLPMITWPHSADQFFNESFIVEVAKVGITTSGEEVSVNGGYEDKMGVLVINKENLVKAIDTLMDGGEGEERRKRAKELGDMARNAMEEGGSSYVNMTTMIQDIIGHVRLVFNKELMDINNV